jgi:hypothetical protein
MWTLHLALSLVLLFQSENPKTIERLFGLSFRDAVQTLQQQNAGYLEKQGLSKEDIGEQNKAPGSLDPNFNALSLNHQNFGAAIVSSLSNDSITTELLNLIFCKQTDRVMAVELLIRKTKSTDNASEISLVQQMFSLPAGVSFETHHPAMKYPLPGITYTDDGLWQAAADALPVSVWEIGRIETVFQPIRNGSSLNGQLWITNKTFSNECAGGPGNK